MHRIFAGTAWSVAFVITLRLNGWFYALTLGALTAIVLFLVNRLIAHWRDIRTRDAIFLSIALLASLAGATMGFANMVDDYYSCESDSEQLQLRIAENPRFKNVTATYSGPITHRVLTISGSVASMADKSALLAKADQDFWGFKTTVRWRVRVCATHTD